MDPGRADVMYKRVCGHAEGRAQSGVHGVGLLGSDGGGLQSRRC